VSQLCYISNLFASLIRYLIIIFINMLDKLLPVYPGSVFCLKEIMSESLGMIMRLDIGL